jgi:hypothetical protein
MRVAWVAWGSVLGPIVTRFAWGDNAVTASCRRAVVVASITVDEIAVVALLTVIDNAITASF